MTSMPSKPATLAAPDPSDEVRWAYQLQQSDEHFNAALSNADLLRGFTAATQAGYWALLTAVSLERLETAQDHPNGELAAEGACALGVSVDDIVMSRELAASYYTQCITPAKAHELGQVLAWAERVRTAARTGVRSDKKKGRHTTHRLTT